MSKLRNSTIQASINRNCSTTMNFPHCVMLMMIPMLTQWILSRWPHLLPHNSFHHVSDDMGTTHLIVCIKWLMVWYCFVYNTMAVGKHSIKQVTSFPLTFPSIIMMNVDLRSNSLNDHCTIYSYGAWTAYFRSFSNFHPIMHFFKCPIFLSLMYDSEK